MSHSLSPVQIQNATHRLKRHYERQGTKNAAAVRMGIMYFVEKVLPVVLRNSPTGRLRDLKGAGLFELWLALEKPNARIPEKSGFHKACLLHNLWPKASARPFGEVVANLGGMVWYDLQDIGADLVMHLATHGNVRGYGGSPIPVSRRMAHVFQNLEKGECRSKDIFLYCFIKSQGYSKDFYKMARNYIEFRVGDSEYNHYLFERWSPVLRNLWEWNVINLVPEHKHAGLLGFISHRIQEMNSFSFRNRTLKGLLNAANRYYEQIRQERAAIEAMQDQLWGRIPYEDDWDRDDAAARVLRLEWPSCGKEEWNLRVGKSWYAIFELTSYRALAEESLQLGHCVHTYAPGCCLKRHSIWSLRERRDGEKEWKSKVTIELSPMGEVTQAKSKFNQTPSENHLDFIREWSGGVIRV